MGRERKARMGGERKACNFKLKACCTSYATLIIINQCHSLKYVVWVWLIT